MLPAPRIAPISFGEIGEQNRCSFKSIVAEIGVGVFIALEVG
jgi:hypothetical protein